MRDDAEDQVQVTEDLAARMPYGASNPAPLQDSTNLSVNGGTSAPAAASPYNNQLIQLDGATGDLFSPLSMDKGENKSPVAPSS